MTIHDVKTRNEKRLMDLPGVVGVAIGQNAAGKSAILVTVQQSTASLRQQLPEQLEGYPVEVDDLKGGEISAF